ncbi:MAG: hypothetical protein ACRBCT_09400 [Alphaproteobacteria bacterium]
MRYITLLTAALLFAPPAMAQQCATTPEAIIKLRIPEIGAFSLWEKEYGKPEFDEQFTSGFARKNGHVIAAGERKTADKTHLIIAELDQRGRKVWEAEHTPKSLQRVVKTFAHKDGFIILAAQKDAAWIGMFDFEGALKSQKRIAIPNMSITPHDLVPAPRGKGFVMAASTTGQDGAPYSLFIRLNTKFQRTAKRSYQTGLANEVLRLIPHEHGLIGAGYMKDDHGRETGWLLRFEEDGAIGWQKQFPRGNGARLNGLKKYETDRIIAYGEATPAGNGDTAGWIMLTDADSGDIQWQRYYTSKKYAYRITNADINNDGLISILLDGKTHSDKQSGNDVIKDQAGRALGNRSDYVRLMTLNPRGVIFDSMHFFHGEGADASTLIRGKKQERILIGASDIHYENAIKTIKSREGWIVAAPALEPYTDPCE